MEKVLGIGGLFFRSHDPGGLAKWYADNLGVDATPEDYNTLPWRQNGGSTVFSPFKADTTYFSRSEQQWMINFRVRDLDVMMAQLKGAGIKVAFEADEPNGRFARLTDPDGNPIQLWQPRGIDEAAEETR